MHITHDLAHIAENMHIRSHFHTFYTNSYHSLLRINITHNTKHPNYLRKRIITHGIKHETWNACRQRPTVANKHEIGGPIFQIFLWNELIFRNASFRTIVRPTRRWKCSRKTNYETKSRTQHHDNSTWHKLRHKTWYISDNES